MEPAPAAASAAPAALTPGAGFTSLVPLRVLDSRTSTGGWPGALNAGVDRDVQVTGVGGANGVPAGAVAVVANVTVTAGNSGSFLTVWPAGVAKPTASNVNFGPGQTIPNLVVAKLSVDGKVRVANAVGSVHVIVDVVGFYEMDSGDGFTGVTPLRALDSRGPNGGWNAPLAQGQTKALQITGVGGAAGVPAGASAVVINTTVTDGSKGSFLTVWPEGVARPAAASNLNFGPGQTIPNLVMAKLSPSGKVNIYNELGSVHVIVDIVGYYDGSPDAGRFHPIVPNRVLDSRNNTGGFASPWTAGLSRSVAIGGVGEIPVEATGAVLNTTVTEGSTGSFLTVYPTGVPRPTAASNVNFGPKETIPNLVVVKTGTGSKVDIYNELGSVHVIADAVGYFAPDPEPVDPTIPPDPKTVAPPLDPNMPPDPAGGIGFLYSGASPIQTGVAPGTIDPSAAGVLKGSVRKRGGAPLPGVVVAIAGHPEYGQTKTRVDGAWDLVVNAPPAPIRVTFTKPSYLPAQRTTSVLAGEFEALDDVVLIPLDTNVATVQLASGTTQVARGSAMSDVDGTRTSTLVVPAGTSAVLRMPNGSTQTVGAINVRQTEYTVGADGPATMPGSLPAGSGYTYAVELSADEALAAGATGVEFSKPLYHYLENFIGFPAGTIVPSGWFDAAKGSWVPSDNGLVVTVIGETLGRADIDVTGDGVADTGAALTALGFTDAERARVAETYDAGASLWRVPIAHFSPWDHNWPFGCPDRCSSPRAEAGNASPELADPPGGSCPLDGSIIGCQHQTLGERVPIAGTPYQLVYESSRVPGKTTGRSIHVPITGALLPDGLLRTAVEVDVAGQHHVLEFPAAPNQSLDWVWDGKDAYGRELNNVVKAEVRVRYTFTAVYRGAAGVEESFGSLPSTPVEIGADRYGLEITVGDRYFFEIGAVDTRNFGSSGWSVDVQSQFNQRSRTIDSGTGDQRKMPIQSGTVATLPTTLANPSVIFALPDGSVGRAENGRIIKTDAAGVDTVLVGTGQPCVVMADCGDGGPALAAKIHLHPVAATAAPDGTIYWSEYSFGYPDAHAVIRKRAPNGIVSRVAGNEQGCDDAEAIPLGCGDGLTALQAPVRAEALAVAPDGALWFTQQAVTQGQGFAKVLRRIGADGKVRTMYGTWQRTTSQGPTGPAAAMTLYIDEFAFLPDGTIAFIGGDQPRLITPDGMLLYAAGNDCVGDPSSECGVGGNVMDARLSNADAVATDAHGYIYLLVHRTVGTGFEQKSGQPTIVKFRPGGIVERVAFEGACLQGQSLPPITEACWGEHGPATAAWGYYSSDFVVVPSGSIFVRTDLETYRYIKREETTLPAGQMGAPTADGTQLEVFDEATGRHIKTIDAYTGAILLTFGYNAAGLLTTISDVDGNVTTFERAANGNLTGILAPFGQHTTVTTGSNGYLSSVTAPGNRVTSMTYDAGGLLTSFTEPGPAVHTMEYDAQGRLTKDINATGGVTTLTRSLVPGGFTVAVTSPGGRSTSYTTTSVNGRVTSETIDAAGGSTTTVTNAGGDGFTTTLPDGSTNQYKTGPDPRWGTDVQIPEYSVLRTPGNKTTTTTFDRDVVLADETNLMSVTSITDRTSTNDRVSTEVYDAGTRTTTVTTPEGHSSILGLDAKGHLLTTERVGFAPVTLTYDAKGRVVTRQQGGRSTSATYDAAGRIATETNGTGTVTTYAYNAADQLTSVTRGGRTWTFGYDVRGNRTSVKMPSGVTHQLAHNADDLMTAYTAPSTPARTFQRDGDGAPTSVAWPTGRVAATTYDAGARVSGYSQPGGSAAFGFVGATPRIASAGGTTPAGTATSAMTYDGELVTSADWSGLVDASLDYQYDNTSWLTQLSLSSGADNVVVPVGRNDDGGLAQVGPFTFSSSGPGGSLASVSDGTGDVSLGYAPTGEVDDRHLRVGGSTRFREQVTARDLNGRVKTVVETTPSGSHTFTYNYDALGRLTSAKRDSDPAITYSYDANGNATANGGTSSSFDAADRVTNVDGTAYTHDADGYLSGRGADSFAYGVRGELRTATVGGQTVSYGSDAIGRRVTRTTAAGTEQYIWGDPGNFNRLTASRGADGQLSFYWYDDDTRLVAITRGGSTFYVGTDRLGTPKIVTDSTGTVVLARTYDAFGRKLSDSNAAFGLPIGFAGGLEDPTTGLVRMGQRDYVPEAAQFAAADPILFEGGLNLYSYVGGDPVNGIDRTGLKPTCLSGGLYLGLGGGGEVCFGVDDKFNPVFSVCVEGGAGLNEGIGVTWKDPASTSFTVFGEGGVTVAGLSAGLGAEGGWAYDKCGKVEQVVSVGSKTAVGYASETNDDTHAIETHNASRLAGIGIGIKMGGRLCWRAR